VARAQRCVVQLTELVSAFDVTPLASTTTLPLRAPPPDTDTLNDTSVESATKAARGLADELEVAIERTEEPGQVEELLELHDQIMALLSELSMTSRETPTRDGKLHGLGITLDGGVGGRSGLKVAMNGHAMGVLGKEEEEEEEELTMPRMDKGKGRAEPEPEEHEKVVLSPTLIFSSSAGMLGAEEEDEDEEGLRYVSQRVEDAESAMDR